MKKVKEIFFLSEEEVIQKRKETGNNFIYHQVPHFIMEDDSIIYGQIGYPAGGEIWFK